MTKQLYDYNEITVSEAEEKYNKGYKVICDADYLVINIEKEDNNIDEK